MPCNDFHGLELRVRTFSGAAAVRVIHRPHQEIGAHTHDWPCLTLPILGAYTENYDAGAATIEGPAAILHPAMSSHSNRISERGLETFSIQFDPAWLPEPPLAMRTQVSQIWSGGEMAIAAGKLISLWTATNLNENKAQRVLGAFLELGSRSRRSPTPSWIESVDEAIDNGLVGSAQDIAHRVGLHPAWLARVYRSLRGEGVQDRIRRRRVEHAVDLLRHSVETPADIAFQAGFCDQSHMSRAFKIVMGRTPGMVRREAAALATGSGGTA